jgi:sarcosine oxidase subunit gamma
VDDPLIREQAVAEYAIVRGDARVLGEAIGMTLPETPNTVAPGAKHHAWWLGPDEWLLVAIAETDDGLERALRPLLAGRFASVVDVSSGFVMLHLTGTRAREILQRGCPLDLHPRVFPIGACAQSHFFKAAIIVRPVDDHAFEVIVRRSFADYALRMLRDAAAY